MAKMGSHGFSRQEVRTALSRDDRAQLKQLKGLAKQLRVNAREAVKQAKEACMIAVQPALTSVDEQYEGILRRARGRRCAEKKNVRSQCYVNTLRGVLEQAPTADPATFPDYLRGAVAPYRELRNTEQEIVSRRLVSNRERSATKQRKPRRSAGEALKEHREAVLREIPEYLHGLWNRVQRSFKGSAERRAEAFLEWVEAHPQEVAEYQLEHQHGVDSELAEEQYRRARQEEDEQRGRALVVHRAPRAPRPRALPPPAVVEAEIVDHGRRRATPKGPNWSLKEVLGAPARKVSSFNSAELDNLHEHAVMEEAFWMGWRLGNEIEVLRIENHLYIAVPGRQVAKIDAPPRASTRKIVEDWVREQMQPVHQKRAAHGAKRPKGRRATPNAGHGPSHHAPAYPLLPPPAQEKKRPLSKARAGRRPARAA